MFSRLTLRGVSGSILWGYHCAIALKSWSITKERKTGPGPAQYQWKLTAVPTRIEAFLARQRPLLFTAPRAKGPAWAWGVEGLDQVGPQIIIARLGPPEQ